MKVIIRYWVQDTMESGRWIDDEVEKFTAELMINSGLYDKAFIYCDIPEDLGDEEIEGNQHLKKRGLQK